MQLVVGLPLGLSKSLSSATFSEVLTELLEKKEKYSLIVKDDQIIDMIPYKERESIKVEKMLDTIEKQIPVQGYSRALIPSSNVIDLEVVGEKSESVVPGDLVQAGVFLEFSPLNLVNPVVQSYANRRVCSNGMCDNTVLAKYEFPRGGHGEGDQIWQWFRANIKKAYGSLDKIVEGWRRLVNENIAPADRASILEALIKEARIPPETADAIRGLAMETPPNNSWEAMNLITYASTHLIEEPRQIQRAMKAAADFAGAETHDRTCPLCHRKR
jgi:hypothetical protein